MSVDTMNQSGDSASHSARQEAAALLTARQQAILMAMARGLTNRQIASRINFSESTVRMESLAIYRAYGVLSRAAAVAAARAAGHLEVAEPISTSA